MTAPNAPSGLKLTEEQVATLERRCQTPKLMGHIWSACLSLCADWRTLRAERDAKDAEIARLKEVNARFGRTHERHLVLGAEVRERATRAEVRLAAMATVTEADVSALLVALPIDPLRFHARAALEAFVANKTAGGT